MPAASGQEALFKSAASIAAGRGGGRLDAAERIPIRSIACCIAKTALILPLLLPPIEDVAVVVCAPLLASSRLPSADSRRTRLGNTAAAARSAASRRGLRSEPNIRFPQIFNGLAKHMTNKFTPIGEQVSS